VTQYSILRSARWRQAAATEKQKALVGKHLLKRNKLGDPLSEDTRLTKLATMTKGEAANIITRLKHGAQVASLIHFSPLLSSTNPMRQSRFEKKMKAAAKVVQADSKEKLRQAREAVAVGPLST
jgi:ATP-dependent helicase IRC3